MSGILSYFFRILSLDSSRSYVNLGCGKRFHPCWKNIDFLPLNTSVQAHDLRKNIPFDDNSVDFLYTSHCLEHFAPDTAANFVSECHRVLKPYGVFRVVVPDLENIVHAYLRCIDDVDKGIDGSRDRHHWMIIELIDQLCRHVSGGEMGKYWAKPILPCEDFVVQRVGAEFLQARQAILADNHYCNDHVGENEQIAQQVGEFRLGGEPHLWMYDRISLRELLQHAGFRNIRKCAATESAIPRWEVFELDANKDGVPHKPDSLYVECVK